MAIWYLFVLIFAVPFFFVLATLSFFVGPTIALVLMVLYGLHYYATLPVPNDLKVGTVPYVALAGYSRTLVDRGVIGHGSASIIGYDKIRLPLVNNSAVTLFAVDLSCEVDETQFSRRGASFSAYWTGRLAPGSSIDAVAYIREVHADPQYMDRATLKCNVYGVKFDRPKAMLALGSDNVQTLVESRYEVNIRDIDPGENWSTGRNEITIVGAVSNGSTLPLYGVTFECYLDGKEFPKFSTKFDSPVLPNSRRAFQVTDTRAHGDQARPRMQNTSCAVYSYDFGES